jgi:hypothetical protein
MESNHPTGGLLRPAGFEDRMGHQTPAAPSETLRQRVLREIDTDLWVTEAPLRYLGIDMGRRMTVIRLANGELWLHSVAPLTDELRAQLEGLGPIRHVVPASNLHGHLWMEQYAGADLYAARGLREKRPDLTFAGDVPNDLWQGEIDQAVFKGHRMLDEVVFVHRPTRSLIVGDTYFNFGPDAPLMTRLFTGPPGPTRLFRKGVADKAAARESSNGILALDFDRIVTGHGDIVETGGKAAFRKAWLE